MRYNPICVGLWIFAGLICLDKIGSQGSFLHQFVGLAFAALGFTLAILSATGERKGS